MKKYFLKKTSLLAGIIFIGQSLISPIKLFALEYQPLEPNVFPELTTTGSDPLTTFLAQAFSFGLAITAALAVIMIVYGGVEVMLSESVFKKEDGHKKIQNAIYGLLLALVSWLILYIINPKILDWSNIFPK